MHIGICDDEKLFREQLIKELKSFKDIYVNLEITEYNSAEELLEEAQFPELLFLDIEMTGMSGMDLMRKYPALFQNTRVCFLTSYTDYLSEGYEVNAYRYLLKPVSHKKLEELFHSLSQHELLSKAIEIKSTNGTFTVPLEQILYIESHNNYCNVVTATQTLSTYVRLKELEPLLPEEFFIKTHKSYVVNLKHVLAYDKKLKRLEMSNHTYTYLSYRRAPDFEKEFVKFQLNT